MENKLYVNGKLVEDVENAYTVLQLCSRVGVSVPRFCYHRELSIAGNCRMCMVELKNVMKPVVACATSVSNNMHVYTNTDLVKTARENVIEFLLINHPLDCPICDQAGECDLQDQTMIYGSDRGRFNEIKRSVIDKDFGPIVKTVMTRCIHCTRCIRYGEEIIGIDNLGIMGRGQEAEISVYNGEILQHEMIGNITDVCPVGALTIKPYAFKARPWELKTICIVDIFDSLGSKAMLNYKGIELVRVLPARADPLNREWITDKMRFFYEGVTVNRLLFALVKTNGELVHKTFEMAMISYMVELVECVEDGNMVLARIGGEIDVVESMLLRNYTNRLDIYFFYIDNYKKNINLDIRLNWTLNNTINSFLNKPNILLLNVNLKYECAILNSFLYKNINENEDQKIYYVGSIFKNSYQVSHIGISNMSLKSIQKGQHEYCLDLILNKVHFIESSVQPLLKYDLLDYINSLYTSGSSSSYVGINSTELNILESGIHSLSEVECIFDKKLDMLHIFGNVRNIELLREYSGFKVFSSHHMPDKYVEEFDIFLPIVSFHEVNEKDRNYKSIWLNNQLIEAFFYDYLSVRVGESQSNEYLVFIMLSFFGYERNNNLISNFTNDFEKFYDVIEINKKYNYSYSCIFTFNRISRDFYSGVLLNEIMPVEYYKSNVYARNSVTLNKVYTNLMSNYSSI